MSITNWLPLEAYSTGEQFMLEKTAIFAREWLPMCAASQLADRGDYVSATIGGWPVLAVRDDRSIRTFRNTCRHQNMMVMEKPVGHCDVLQCRYHGWQYALDGRFVAAPPLVAPADPTAQSNHLLQLPNAEWNGLIFLSLRGDAPAFAEPPALGWRGKSSGVGKYAFAYVRTTDIACNWKTFVEQRLADNWCFEWPLLAVRSGENSLIVEQIVPRSFLRTRVVTMVFGANDVQAELATAAEHAIQEAVPRIEGVQRRYQSGDTQVIDLPAAHAFRGRVQAAIAG